MTSQDTFEHAFRQRLLDVIYSQWGKAGAPFSGRGASEEVIDPEALLWCSLEFLPTEPRLREAVSNWLGDSKEYLVRQRVYKKRNQNDPRALIWQALDRRVQTPKAKLGLPVEPCHGISSPADVVEFVRSIEAEKIDGRQSSNRLGRIAVGSATLLLKARDLLGHDIRHFLLIYLLANPHGGKLREVQAWSGHAYRSLSEIAVRWVTANIVTLESGYCRLIAPEPFRVLLQIKSAKIILINWWTVFDISVRFLRDLAKARQKGFDVKSTIVRTLQREAAEKLELSLPITEKPYDSSIGYLLRGFPRGD